MISTVITLSIISFILCLSGGRFKGEKGIKNFTIVIWLFCWLITLLTFIISLNEISYKLVLIKWIKIGVINLEWQINVNKITTIMMLLVISVSSLVHIYSLSYMGDDPHLARFISYLSLFTFFMLVLITSPNLIQIFIGWEGVGVCSYLLISFWSTRLLACQSAYKAMAVNKIGDMSLLIAIGIIIKETGTIDMNSINMIGSFESNHKMILITSILIFIAICGKSAQISLHMWLPDAMEGPTPVSALIHAATMVTAGVFLLIKLSPIFISIKLTNFIILILGAITCVFSAAIGCTQSDLKKVIAYSTCSQLGYMILICGYGYYNISLYHIFNHGIFKALLFLSGGLIIHTLSNEQNMLKMGLKGKSEIGKIGLITGSLAIVGFPFLTGFYSKDILLELLAAENKYFFPLWMGYLAASLTCFYSIKTIYIAYNNNYRFNFIENINFHKNPIILMTPLIILGVSSVSIGYITSKSINSLNKPIITSNLIKLIPIIILIVITFISLSSLIKLANKRTIKLLVNSLYINELISRVIIIMGINSYKKTYKLIDSQILEWTIPSIISKWTINKSSFTSIITNKWLPSLIKLIFFMVIILIII